MMNAKQVEQLLDKTIKKVISDQEISLSNRKGNKELRLLTKKIARHPFASSEEVMAYGEKIGKAIANLSAKKGKKNLDQGVIRQIFYLSEEVTELATTKPIKKAKTPSSSKVEMVIPPQTSNREDSSASVVETAATGNLSQETEEVEKIPPEVDAISEKPLEVQVETPEPSETEDFAEAMAESEVVTPEMESVMEEVSETEDSAEETPEIEEEEAKTEALTEETPEVEEEESKTESKVEEVIETEQRNGSIPLKDRITEDIKTAMKAKDKIRLETVRSIKKALLEKEVEVRPSGQETLTPEQELDLLSQQAKQRRDSIEQYQKAGRDDLVEKESQELAIIETYLPPQLSDEELEEIVTKIIADIGATSPKDMGKVMGPAMKELKGKADGKKVQEIVKSKLT